MKYIFISLIIFLSLFISQKPIYKPIKHKFVILNITRIQARTDNITRLIYYKNLIKPLLKATNDTVIIKELLCKGAIESGWGRSILSKRYNNYFGMKSNSSNINNYIALYGVENINGKLTQIKSKWKKYLTIDECILERMKLKGILGSVNPTYYNNLVQSINTIIAKELTIKIDLRYVHTINN